MNREWDAAQAVLDEQWRTQNKLEEQHKRETLAHRKERASGTPIRNAGPHGETYPAIRSMIRRRRGIPRMAELPPTRPLTASFVPRQPSKVQLRATQSSVLPQVSAAQTRSPAPPLSSRQPLTLLDTSNIPLPIIEHSPYFPTPSNMQTNMGGSMTSAEYKDQGTQTEWSFDNHYEDLLLSSPQGGKLH